jgi:hypothetical protein
MYYTNHYVVDVEKIKTLEDVKLIIKALAISFEPNLKNLSEVEHLCTLQPKGTPIAING